MITGFLRRHGRDDPDRPALVCGKITFTYRHMWEHALASAQWLSSQGVKHQDRVILFVAPADPWFVAAYFGIHLLGAVAVPLDAKGQEATTQRVRQQVEPAFLLSGTLLEELKKHLQSNEPNCDLTTLQERFTDGSPGDTADILFTSGSTGEPKGVVLTHANITAATRNMIAFIGNTSGDREVVTVPLHHSFGLGRLRSNVMAGGTLILVPGLSFPSLVFNALSAHKATGLACVPAGIAVLRKVGGERLREYSGSIRYMEIGSARMEATAKQALMKLLPRTRICMHYGLTEASRSAFMEFHADAAKLDSVGRATPNVEIGVTDEAGQFLPPGSSGRIKVRSQAVMKEYWRNPSRTQEVMNREGWLDTGDLGHLDEGNYLFLHGRVDDVINVGGNKVNPVTVEDAAAEFPGVLESACVGAPDPDGFAGEVPVLYVVAAPDAGIDAGALLRFLATRLDLHALPRAVHFTEQLPRTASGKLQRMRLRSR